MAIGAQSDENDWERLSFGARIRAAVVFGLPSAVHDRHQAISQ
jgi:hypothetical protein